MNKNAFKETLDTLRHAYETLNTLGKFTLFPMFVLLSPWLFFIVLATKSDERA